MEAVRLKALQANHRTVMLWIFSIIATVGASNDGTPSPGGNHPDHQVSIDGYPHHVFIEGLPFKCSGAIISPQFVVTTASCALEMRKPYEELCSNSSIWGKSGNKHRIVEVISHEDHQLLENGNPINDIALIRVGKFFETHQCIDLLGKGEKIQVGDSVNITGVGEDEGQEKLMEMQASIVANEKCNLDARSSDQFCIKYRGQPLMGAYNDDYGDLAVYEGERGKKRLVGIHSSDGLGSMNETEPFAVYTNITYHHDWILRKIGIRPN